MKNISRLVRLHYGRLRQHFPAVIGAALCSLFAGLFMLTIPVLLGRLVAAFPRVPGRESALLILFLIMRALLAFTSYRTIAKIAAKLVFEMRGHVFEKIIYAPIAFHRNTNSAALVSAITSDAALVEQMLLSLIPVVIQHGAIVLAGSVYLLLFHLRLFGILVLTLTPILLFLLIMGKNVRNITRLTQRNMSAMAIIVQASLLNLNLVKRLVKEKYFSREFDEYNQELLGLKERRIRSQALVEACLPVFLVSAGAWVAWLLKNEFAFGELSVNELTTFAAGLTIIGASAGRLLQAYINLGHIAGAVDRMHEALPVETWEPAIDDKSKAGKDRAFGGPLEIAHLSFVYPGGGSGVFDINLRINDGEVVSLTGPNGAGKSTLVDCILRLQELQDGTIHLGGTDFRNVDIKQWRAQFGVLTRETYLFDTTIGRNIALAGEKASLDDVIRASKLSGLHDQVCDLPLLYETRVGENGLLLSSGQRQLVALTRIFLQDPSVVILDEAMVSLDREVRPRFFQALRQWQQNKMIIIISHEPDDAWPHSQSIIMNAGRVVSEGMRMAGMPE